MIPMIFIEDIIKGGPYKGFFIKILTEKSRQFFLVRGAGDAAPVGRFGRFWKKLAVWVWVIKI